MSSELQAFLDWCVAEKTRLEAEKSAIYTAADQKQQEIDTVIWWHNKAQTFQTQG